MLGDHLIETFFEGLASAVGWPGDFSPIALNQLLKLVMVESAVGGVIYHNAGCTSMHDNQ